MEDIRWSDYLNGDFDDEDAVPHNHNQHNGPSPRGLYLGNDGHQMHSDLVPTPEYPPKAAGPPEEWHIVCEDGLYSFPKEIVTDCGGSDHVPHAGCDIQAVKTLPGEASCGGPSSPDTRRTRRPHRADIFLIVRDWLSSHEDDYYPTTEEKEEFARSWDMTLVQVSTLFNNERQRRFKRDYHSPVAHPTRGDNPSLTSSLIETASLLEGQSPIDRYLASSSEEDPQSPEIVASAAVSFKENYPPEQSENSRGLASGKRERRISQDDSKVEKSSISGISSNNGSTAQSSLTGSSYTSGKRGKRRRINVRQTTSNKGRYYCTYCWKNFISGTSWRRHEETVHRPQKEFECRMAELTPTLLDCGACLGAEPGCYCSLMHNYKGCLNRTKEARTFNRKDHFRNHLFGCHHADYTPIMESWVRSTSNNTRRRCGYCCKWFPTWTERLDHIGNHYRYHDDFDRSKWQPNGNDPDEDRNAEAIIQSKDNKNKGNSALMLSRQQQDDLKAEMDNNFDASLLAGSGWFFNDWQNWKPLKIRRLRHSSSTAGLGSKQTPNQDRTDSLHDLSCPASQGGRCKFELLPQA